MKRSNLFLVAFLSLFLAACASSNSGSVYSRDDARKVQTIKTGVVESVRSVKLKVQNPLSALLQAAQLAALQAAQLVVVAVAQLQRL